MPDAAAESESERDEARRARSSRSVYRHRLPTRLWHWLNALTVFVMLMSGLMIFNAHPHLYWGQYGANFDHPWLSFHGRPIPGWATIPSTYNLAAARRWHLAFAWLLVVAAAAVPDHEPDQPPCAARPRADAATNRPSHIWHDIQRACAAALPDRRRGAEVQHPAEAQLRRRDLRPAAADGADRPYHVAGDGRGLAVAARPVRRPSVGALDPLHLRRGAARLHRGPSGDGGAGRADQRDRIDDHRPLPSAAGQEREP